MSYEMRFGLSVSVSKPMRVPAGTIKEIEDRIAETETKLGFKREKYLDNPARWVQHDIAPEVDDDLACEVVSAHNRFCDRLWDELGEWSNKKPDGKTELLTVKKSAELFPFLCELHLSPERWNRDFYQEQMDRLYEVMRGRPTDGITFDAKALTERQVDEVIALFSQFLDTGDIRLAVPKGHDCLMRNDTGDYEWCDKCFHAIAANDRGDCRKRGCPLKEQEGG